MYYKISRTEQKISIQKLEASVILSQNTICIEYISSMLYQCGHRVDTAVQLDECTGLANDACQGVVQEPLPSGRELREDCEDCISARSNATASTEPESEKSDS